MKKFLFISFSISLIIIVSTLAGISKAKYPLKIIDSYNNETIIEKNPKKIISLAPSVTEILFSLGLDSEIIAVTNNCNYPPAAFKKQKIGDIHINAEKIISLKPDLIISEGSIQLETSQKFKKLGIPIIIIQSDNLENFKNSFLIIGKTCGKEKLAVKLIKDMENHMDKIEQKIKKLNQKKPKVYFEIWNIPLQTAGPETFINEIIEKAGGINIFAKAKCKYPITNLEEITYENPDVIVLTTSKAKDIYSQKTWGGISAIKNKRVYEINPDIISRPTLRLLEAQKFLSKCFYPGLKNE